MKKIFIPLTIILLFYGELKAQNPFEQFGYDVKILTMTNGKFNEFFDLDSIQQIGEVLINTNTMKIVGFAEKDSVNPMPDASLISRWVCPDPLAEKYYFISPYTYVVNNPIVFIDPNGMEVWKPEFNEDGNIVLKKERGDNAETLHSQLSASGYNTTIEQAEELVSSADENGDINLSQNTSAIEGTDLETTVNLVTEQINKATKGNDNCVNVSMISLKEYKENGTYSNDWGSDWKIQARNKLDKNYTDTDQALKGGESIFVMYAPGSKKEEGEKPINHTSRFFMKGKRGQNWAIHKYSGGRIVVKKANRWEDNGKIKVKIFNPVK